MFEHLAELRHAHQQCFLLCPDPCPALHQSGRNQKTQVVGAEVDCRSDTLGGVQWGIFLFFGGMIFLGTTMVYFLYPETKGLAMEDAPNVFKDHWYWKRYAQRPNRLREAVSTSSQTQGINSVPTELDGEAADMAKASVC